MQGYGGKIAECRLDCPALALDSAPPHLARISMGDVRPGNCSFSCHEVPASSGGFFVDSAPRCSYNVRGRRAAINGSGNIRGVSLFPPHFISSGDTQ